MKDIRWPKSKRSIFMPFIGACMVTTLSVASCTHAQTAGTATAGQGSSITVNSCSHTLANDLSSLSHIYQLGVNSTGHSQNASTSSMEEVSQGAFIDILKPITKFTSQFIRTPRGIGPAGANVIGSINTLHYLISTSPTFTFSIFTILPENGIHTQNAESPNIQKTSSIDSNNTTHIQSSILPSLGVAGSITPDATIHATSSDSPTFSHVYLLNINSTNHIQTASLPSVGELAAGAFVDILKPITKFTSQFIRTPRGVGAAGAITVDSINTLHYQTATSPELTFGLLTLLPDNAIHSQSVSPSNTGAGITFLNAFIRHIFRACTEMTPYFMPIPLSGEGISGWICTRNTEHGHSVTSISEFTFSLYTAQSRNATHSQIAGSPEIVEKKIVTPDISSHVQISELPGITEKKTVNPNSTVHATQSTSSTISHIYALSPNNTTHSESSTVITLVEKYSINPNNCIHVQSTESSSLGIAGTVYPASCIHIQTPSASILSVGASISVANCSHSQAATSTLFTHLYNLVVNGSSHSQITISPDIVESGSVQSSSCIHNQIISEPSLVSKLSISPNNGNHLQSVNSPTILEILAILIFNDTIHLQQISQATLVQKYTIQPNDTVHNQTAEISVFGMVLANDALHITSCTSPTISEWTNFVPENCFHTQTVSKSAVVGYTTVCKEYFHAKDICYRFVTRKPRYFFMAKPIDNFPYSNNFINPNNCTHNQGV